MKNRHLIAGFLLTILLCAPSPAAVAASAPEKPAAGAEANAGEKKDDKKDEKEKEPVLSVTEHEITLGGKVIKYRATAGYMAMKDAKNEKTKANIFFVAYTKLGTDADKVD
ncbi:MAG: hypothetical protein NTV51_30500, partial [Verrucomicrobia bacterium]|nr:hypothetical protein [Verrucomicrobiota bacterium]